MRVRLTLLSSLAVGLSLLYFQNCGESPPGQGENHSVSVLCHPTGSCLKFHLTTYDKMDCASGQNKVVVDTLTVQNAAVLSDVKWTGCDKKSSNSACCEQGDVSAQFATIDGSKDITLFFNNDVDYKYNYVQN